MEAHQVVLPRRFAVLVDTREKPNHRLFELGPAPPEHDPIIEYRLQKLDTGDYAIAEAQTLVCVEKKKSR